MNLRPTLIVALAASLLAATFSGISQKAEDPPAILSPDSTAAAKDALDFSPYVIDPKMGGIGRYGIDLTTFELVDKYPDDTVLLNSPEDIETRRASMLQLLDPDEYLRQFPKTTDQMNLEAVALAEIAIPLTPEERASRQTPEANAVDQKVMAEMLAVKPVSNPDDAPNAPGASAPAVQDAATAK